MNREFYKRSIFIALLILIVINIAAVTGFVTSFISASSPIIYAAIMAYVSNILMKKFESLLDKVDWIKKSYIRGIAIVLTLISFMAVFVLVAGLVIPQLVSLVSTLIETIPKSISSIQVAIEEQKEIFPVIGDFVGKLDLNWSNISQSAIDFVNGFTQNLLKNGIDVIRSTFSSTTNFILALMISIYMLISKETLQRQFNLLLDGYFPKNFVEKIHYYFNYINSSFSSFIVGTVTEAVILGSLITIGMTLLGLPYALMIGVVTSVLALIPMIGAFISALIGFVIILPQSPAQALVYLIFVLIVQQIEGNLIYPRVVGNSIGLPGLWVIISVTVGGGLLGIPGMLIGVPLMASLYSILRDDINKRNSKNEKV